MKFFVREILEATPRSRVASQGGSRRETGRNDLDAATGDPQSNLRFTRTTPRDCAMGYERNIHRTSDQGEFLAAVSPSSAGEKAMTPSPSPFGQRSEPHSQHFQNATKGGNEFVAICCNVTRRINAVQHISMSRLHVNRRLIVWLAARRQGSFALLPFDFHL